MPRSAAFGHVNNRNHDASTSKPTCSGLLSNLDRIRPAKLEIEEGSLYAALTRETSMSLYDLVTRNSSCPLQTIDVLREQLQQESLVIQQTDERVSYGRPVFPRIQLMGKSVKGKRILAKE